MLIILFPIFLALALLGFIGQLVRGQRIFAVIPKNHVGAVEVNGNITHYVVGTKEDLDKLTNQTITKPDGTPLTTLKGKHPNEGKVRFPSDPLSWFLGILFNMRIFSFNPFATLRPVIVKKNRPNEKQLDENDRVIDRISYAPMSERVPFLRIDSVRLVYVPSAELKNLVTINMVIQTSNRVVDLDQIYLAQNGNFSEYLDDSIRAAVISYVKQFDQVAFQAEDFSEGSTKFYDGIDQAMKGVFGFIVLTIAITDYELTQDQQEIVAANRRLEAAEQDRKSAILTAKGRKEAIELTEGARATVAGQRIRERVNQGVDPNVAAVTDAEVEKLRELTINNPNITTLAMNSGALPTIQLPTSQPKKEGGADGGKKS